MVGVGELRIDLDRPGIVGNGTVEIARLFSRLGADNVYDILIFPRKLYRTRVVGRAPA